MRLNPKIACLAVVLLAGCQPSGSYDSHGNYHSSDQGWQGQSARRTSAADDMNEPGFAFAKRGFYDGNGAYAGDNDSFGVPADFLPPRGMCRIWVPDRALSTQGAAEPCRQHYTLHHGAYVIYGG